MHTQTQAHPMYTYIYVNMESRAWRIEYQTSLTEAHDDVTQTKLKI